MVEPVEPDAQDLGADQGQGCPASQQVPPAIPSHADSLRRRPCRGTQQRRRRDAAAEPRLTAAADAMPSRPTPQAAARDPDRRSRSSPSRAGRHRAETELKLAELAALLPVAAAAQDRAAQQEGGTRASREQPPEDASAGRRAAEETAARLVPPAPLSTPRRAGRQSQTARRARPAVAGWPPPLAMAAGRGRAGRPDRRLAVLSRAPAAAIAAPIRSST